MDYIIEDYKVYVLPDASGYIVAVNSDAFLDDLTGWVEIDSGTGDKYHHAQGHYFPQPIMTDGGAYRYKLVDGVPVECSAEEITEQEAANAPEPGTEDTGDASAVWDELDAAYTAGYNAGYEEGVNNAYVNE